MFKFESRQENNFHTKPTFDGITSVVITRDIGMVPHEETNSNVANVNTGTQEIGSKFQPPSCFKYMYVARQNKLRQPLTELKISNGRRPNRSISSVETYVPVSWSKATRTADHSCGIEDPASAKIAAV